MPYQSREAQPRCPACGTAVYPPEQVIVSDRKPMHRACMKCFACHVNLNSRTMNEHNTRLYCKSCYETYFNQQVISMNVINGTFTEEDKKRQLEKARLHLVAEGVIAAAQRRNSGGPRWAPGVQHNVDVQGLVAIAPADHIIAGL